MELLEQLQKAGLADPQICVYLPDAVHVGKSCKCSFSNWFCLLDEAAYHLQWYTHFEKIAIPLSSHNFESFLPKKMYGIKTEWRLSQS